MIGRNSTGCYGEKFLDIKSYMILGDALIFIVFTLVCVYCLSACIGFCFSGVAHLERFLSVKRKFASELPYPEG